MSFIAFYGSEKCNSRLTDDSEKCIVRRMNRISYSRKLEEWLNSFRRKPLILEGARQVGKTWLMRDFGRKHFARVHEFNFDDTPDLASVFEGTKDPTSILARLAA